MHGGLAVDRLDASRRSDSQGLAISIGGINYSHPETPTHLHKQQQKSNPIRGTTNGFCTKDKKKNNK